MSITKHVPISVDEYLAEELVSDVKHEYLGGYAYAMAGATNVHNRVAANLLGVLHAQLRGKPCEPFNSDTKVRIEQAAYPRFYYPDGMVVCDPNDPEETFQDRPVLIAEVISESTRRTDDGEKRSAYQTIPTLDVYLVLETESPCVTVHRRTSEGFEIELYEGIDAVIPLSTIEAEVPLQDLYERVQFAK
ncbi:Uma2 family endonuclease [Aeoliella mucimassa]|uniref:Putative restriction endonuclease domain-containing protein n=1 Tax=Aeoliella mucimassa TaxID=2527972 RepID=A0A518AGV0_9BACT|nr:Uma2 family endonuclease [Aeoliella mucimassa]QDU53947.1 hypothetical protein Pan181_01260 [Aeoliella mucimassa]